MIQFLVLCLLSGAVFGTPVRDPTLPPATINEISADFQALNLTAILMSPNRTIAVINNSMLRVGESILGNKIVSIQPNTVQLEGVNGKITLFLTGNPIKQKSN